MSNKRANGDSRMELTEHVSSAKKNKQEDEDQDKLLTMRVVPFRPESDVYRTPWKAIGSWFLGPRAENNKKFKEFVNCCLDWYGECREGYFPTDPHYITDDIKASDAYRKEMNDIKEQLHIMHTQMVDSVPFFSPRYKGHMNWETTMPSILGYLAGMLWNQNNVDSSASPVTTGYEVAVGKHLCGLMGFYEANASNIQPWGHLTGCGSVANIEAMWAARNLKFHPLATKAIVMDDDAGLLADGKSLKVHIPTKKWKISLEECTTWELLNMTIDDVCKLTDDLLTWVAEKNPSTTVDALRKKFDALLEKHSVVSVGLHQFMNTHGITNTPVICSPGTNHYSWPKGVTLLGIGDKNIKEIHVDENARQSIEMLCDELDKCVANQIPVIMVVAVVGSTEESAVDPLARIIELRDHYCYKKGLNFSVHTDAAWGGYMLTMLREPDEKSRTRRRDRGEDFVPYFGLWDYAETQYKAIRNADTVTIDPHKTGFCQYPAGALAYRNGTMKDFITLKAPEVFHDPDDISVGVYGLEGSKPGAAACGVLLSHQIIGLDQYGYGRILGQCQFGSKLFYCMWMTVAEDFDDFICVNLIDVPAKSKQFPYTQDEAKRFIKEEILGKDNTELHKNRKAKKFLSQIGPDALINTFVVNLKNNTNTEVCNQLQKKIFAETSNEVGESTKRTPMFLTTSVFEQKRYGLALTQLKKRLNLPTDDASLDFLRNTVMNPFQSSEGFVTEIGKLFRNTVLNSIGGLQDPADQHTFIVVNKLDEDSEKIFLDYLPCFGLPQFRYHVILTCKVSQRDMRRLSNCQEEHQMNGQIFLRTKNNLKMMDLLKTKDEITVDVVRGSLDEQSQFKLDITIYEIIRYHHLEKVEVSQYVSYPENQTYFLYGDKGNAYISHIMTKYPDFHQVVRLDEKPHSVPDELIDHGIPITIPDIEGKPLYINSEIHDPLQATSYKVQFRGKLYTECSTTISFGRKNAKIRFDSRAINTIT